MMMRYFPLIVLLLSACSVDEHTKNTATQTDIFTENKILDYDIRMQDADWQAMSQQGRNLGVIAGACNTFTGYDFFNASVTLDGERFDDVNIRKKGGLGSLSVIRPSIKLDMQSSGLNNGRQFRGHRRITLNNNFQDASNLEQCLAYYLFNQAGIKAPRCNLASVKVQGKNLGIYSHVEAIKKPFLQRVFLDDSGNLYEGENADFNSALLSRFEKKTNKSNTDRSDLEAVMAALLVDDDQLFNSLDQLINMDNFLTFMAMEALIGHSDSYNGSQGNFYIYNNPEDQRFYFIPWGTDQTFQEEHVSRNVIDNHSVLLRSELAHRIWQVSELRQMYDDKMRLLLNTVWNEALLLDWVNEWALLAQVSKEYISPLQLFIQQRRSQIEAELGDDTRSSSATPRRTVPTSDSPNCKTLERFSGTFSGQWHSFDNADIMADFNFNYRLKGEHINLISNAGTSLSGSNAGIDDRHIDSPYDRATLSFWKVEGEETHWVSIILPPQLYTVGQHRLHAYESFAVFGNDTEGFLGFISDGTVTLQQTADDDSLMFSGSIDAKVIP